MQSAGCGASSAATSHPYPPILSPIDRQVKIEKIAPFPPSKLSSNWILQPQFPLPWFLLHAVPVPRCPENVEAHRVQKLRPDRETRRGRAEARPPFPLFPQFPNDAKAQSNLSFFNRYASHPNAFARVNIQGPELLKGGHFWLSSNNKLENVNNM